MSDDEPVTESGKMFVALHGDMLGKAPLSRLLARIELEARALGPIGGGAAPSLTVHPSEVGYLRLVVESRDWAAIAAFVDDLGKRGGAVSAGAVVALRDALGKAEYGIRALGYIEEADTYRAILSDTEAVAKAAFDAEWQRRLALPETRERLMAALATRYAGGLDTSISWERDARELIAALRAGAVDSGDEG